VQGKKKGLETLIELAEAQLEKLADRKRIAPGKEKKLKSGKKRKRVATVSEGNERENDTESLVWVEIIDKPDSLSASQSRIVTFFT